MNFQKKAIIISLYGNIIEYYDYALYGFLATEISQHFFPAQAEVSIRILAAYGVFSLGALAKPLGNIIFSHLGDRFGRVYVLKWSIGLTFLSTLGLGLLPSYTAWGIGSTVGLIVCRLLQGLAIGGEKEGTTLLVSEHFGYQYRHTALGLSGLASSLGIFFAAYAARLVIKNPLLDWQNLYLFGAMLSLLLVILRQFLQESASFMQKNTPFMATKSLFKEKKWLLIAIIFFMGGNGALYHYYIVFLTTYLSDLLQVFPNHQAAHLTFYATIGYSISGLLIGWFADKYDWPYLNWCLFCGVFVALALTSLLIYLHVFYSIIFMIGGFFIGASGIPPLAQLIQTIDINKRFRIIGSGHAIGSSLLSGTAPLLGTKLYQYHQNLPLFLGFLFLFLYILGYLGLVFFTKNTQSVGNN